ncbi:tRNA (adenosine(37)-N6)-threonylcarbamoyltransferase complex dimerization subunit type 1 TsaB [Specibacter sp. RAF43]|uniref:tRNA (adenosine(37)-N6)-threonylcarbamoyltransferase complex dimerization subunit type 1 TsaB n=1 Tax=Specibacter sp. RAF43 TaxID=3233057 RepID=UPI003F9DDE51
MRILTIDTSAVASAALLEFDPGAGPDGPLTVYADFATADTRSHAEVLAPGVRALFADAVTQGPALDAIVVGVGPGPFTGLRSGIALARTLSFAWQVPLHGLMSLDALAWDVLFAAPDGAPRAAPDGEFVIATDARRKEIYSARYDADGALLAGPAVGPAVALRNVPVYGAGAGLYAQELAAGGCVVDPAFAHAQPTALSLGRMAARKLRDGAELLASTPLYLRESDAKVPGPRKRAL